jgi:hypothetical protein
MELQKMRRQVTMLLLLTLKRQEVLQKVFIKTAFYGLDTEPQPELEP